MLDNIFFDNRPYSLLQLWQVVLPYIGTALSVLALIISVHDRRPRLTVRARKGEWLRSQQGQRVVGIIEIYNSSSRPNTIRAYHFGAQDRDGKWMELESERYVETFGDTETIQNDTPLIIGPYSGVAVPIAALANERLRRDFQIRVTVEDIFEKKYSATLSVGTKLDLRVKSDS
jgi:hypothetical protein